MTLRTHRPPRSLLGVRALVAPAPLALIANLAQFQPGWVLSQQKIFLENAPILGPDGAMPDRG